MKYILTTIALVMSMTTTNAMASSQSATIDGVVVASTAIMQEIIRNQPEQSFQRLCSGRMVAR